MCDDDESCLWFDDVVAVLVIQVNESTMMSYWVCVCVCYSSTQYHSKHFVQEIFHGWIGGGKKSAVVTMMIFVCVWGPLDLSSIGDILQAYHSHAR